MAIVIYTPKSSSISRLAYDVAEMELEVTFKRDGSVYRYRKVTPLTFHRFANAKSKGDYFNLFIRPHYRPLAAQPPTV